MPEFWYEYVYVNEDTTFLVERNNNFVLELTEEQKDRIVTLLDKQENELQQLLGRLMNETRI